MMSRCFKAWGYILGFETEIIRHPLCELCKGGPLLQINIHNSWLEKFPSLLIGNVQIALCNIHRGYTLNKHKMKG